MFESLHIYIIIIILDSIFIFREAQSSGCLESAQSRFHLPPFKGRHRIHSGDVGGRFVDVAHRVEGILRQQEFFKFSSDV